MTIYTILYKLGSGGMLFLSNTAPLVASSNLPRYNHHFNGQMASEFGIVGHGRFSPGA
jgi:hypothetical protein